MGMFDTVFAPCPRCRDGELTVQSKAGECILRRYPITGVPVEIAADIDGQWMSCDKCDHVSVVKIPDTVPRHIIMVLD